jgi:hypothetical protein
MTVANVARDLLRGAIDLHIHAAPDAIPRLLDDYQLAQEALEVGMGGLVLKSHHMMTADRARLAQKQFPTLKIAGGLALNYPACGGLNPEAVKVAIRLGAAIVWLPTISSVNQIERTRARVTGNLGLLTQGLTPLPVPVVDEDGRVVPALREIMGLVAEAGIVLATGHQTVAEIKLIVAEAKRSGVAKILVNHPRLWLIDMSVEDQRELAAQGVMLERCLRTVTSTGSEGLTPNSIAEDIRAVGADSTVMATDYGQMDSPTPARGMLNYIEAMLECGITPDEIDTMVRINPSRLLVG